MKPSHEIYFGVAGWSYPDGEGADYPKKKTRDVHPLRFLSQYVDCIEINTSFYHPLSERNVKNWLRLVRNRDHFTFTVKLWQRFTHERPAITNENVLTFRRGLEPFLQSGKISALLMQFPWSFKNTDENRNYLRSLIKVFKDAHPAVEVRHGSWENEQFFDFLRGGAASFVNVDQPIVSSSLGPTQIQTADLSYVRLHGQNKENWFKQGASSTLPASSASLTGGAGGGRDARYDYFYDRRELAPWVNRINSLIVRSKSTVVIANNHYRGSAFYNALELKSMVTKKKIPVPPEAQENLPRLHDIAANPVLIS